MCIRKKSGEQTRPRGAGGSVFLHYVQYSILDNKKQNVIIIVKD